MTFPYPEKLEDWQTAYTRERAHRDSQTRTVFFFVPLMLCFLAGFLFAYIEMVRTRNVVSSDILYGLLALGVILLVIFIFVIGLRAAFQFSGKFLEEFYQPPEELDPQQVILYR
jgi:glucan phosphoethanolaminetransferase (alkaline phosphatase superfamily)